MKGLSIQLQYKGDIEEIKANTLLTSLFGYVNLIEEIHKEINIPKKLNIYVKATKKGSFIVDLNLMLDTIDKIKTIFGNNFDLENLKNVAEISFYLIMLKIFLKGKKPSDIKEENGKVIIVNGDGNKIEVDKNVYNIAKDNELVDEFLISMAEPILDDEDLTGFEIKDEANHKVYVDKEDLEYLTNPNPLFEEKTKTVLIKNAVLTVIKVVFAENRKWEFLFQGNKISAYIKDKDFIEKLDAYSFTKGTKLICDLEILQVYDRRLNDYVNEEFTIIKVHEIKPPSENRKLF